MHVDHFMLLGMRGNPGSFTQTLLQYSTIIIIILHLTMSVSILRH